MPRLPEYPPLSSAALAASWNREYTNGRYRDAQPLRFADDILVAARMLRLTRPTGLYVGCGNGRNFRYLVAHGLDLVGLDISLTALRQLADQAAGLRHRLICGDLTAIRPDQAWPVLIGIQVFHHGDLSTVRSHLRRAQNHVAAGGLLCLRVNAAGTDLLDAHDIVEDGPGQTILFRSGPKCGQRIHYFTAEELEELFREFLPILPPRAVWQIHPGPHTGRYGLWEAIWRRL